MKTIFTAIVLSAVLPASASSLTVGRLPALLAAELASGTVSANVVNNAVQSYASHAGFSAYTFSRGDDPFALISYDVLPGSQWDVSWADASPLSGQVFVEAPLFHLPGTSAQLTLHFDQLVPGIPQYAFWSNQPQTTVVLQADAVASGFGVAEATGKYGDPPYTWLGNMSFATFEDEPFLCIECIFFAQFDMVFLDYSSGFLNFNLDDPRTTLFTGFDGFDTSPYGWGLDLVVNQVPLPPALPLMLAALAALGWLNGVMNGVKSTHDAFSSLSRRG